MRSRIWDETSTQQEARGLGCTEEGSRFDDVKWEGSVYPFAAVSLITSPHQIKVPGLHFSGETGLASADERWSVPEEARRGLSQHLRNRALIMCRSNNLDPRPALRLATWCCPWCCIVCTRMYSYTASDRAKRSAMVCLKAVRKAASLPR